MKDTRLHDWIARLVSDEPWKGQQEEGLGEMGEGGVEPEGSEKQ